MYLLPPPVRKGIEDFDNIIARRRDPSKAVLNQSRTDVSNAYSAYLTLSGNGYLLNPIPVGPELSDALKGNFRFLDKGESHDAIRYEILGSALNGFCPYCNVSQVDTIDHVLPTSSYPEFAVLAQNLVPACGTCNVRKGKHCFHSTKENLMHPYYALIPDSPILFADVAVEEKGVSWTFYLQQTADIDNAQFKSIESVFRLLGLADRFYLASLGDISDRWESMERRHQDGGPAEVKKYLCMEAQSSGRSRGENYWKTAILRSLSSNSEFCDWGFKFFGVRV